MFNFDQQLSVFSRAFNKRQRELSLLCSKKRYLSQRSNVFI